MIVESSNLITLSHYAKLQKVSPQRISKIKNKLPIVMIDGQPFIDKSKLGVIDSANISVPIDVTINQEINNGMLDY